jgi:hypothetical protein
MCPPGPVTGANSHSVQAARGCIESAKRLSSISSAPRHSAATAKILSAGICVNRSHGGARPTVPVLHCNRTIFSTYELSCL